MKLKQMNDINFPSNPSILAELVLIAEAKVDVSNAKMPSHWIRRLGQKLEKILKSKCRQETNKTKRFQCICHRSNPMFLNSDCQCGPLDGHMAPRTIENGISSHFQ